jgi:hypothetical protein
MIASSPTERACGRRIRGGIYAETHLSDEGLPIEYDIIDPPIPTDITRLGLAAVGVRLVEVNGVHHIFDVVGMEFYPYPSDYVEETRRLGASRRLPANIDFSRLTDESRLVLLHARAWIVNFSVYPQPPTLDCPKALDYHLTPKLPEMCAGLWWHDLPGEPDESGLVLRRIAGGAYHGHPRPTGVLPIYRHAVFLHLPIHNLAVIQGGEATGRNYRAACASALPVYIEEE